MNPVLTDILSNPVVVRDSLAEGERRLPEVVSELKAIKPRLLYAIGAGSSYFVGLAGRYLIESFARTPTKELSSKDFQFYAKNALSEGDVVIAISQSGETVETIEAVKSIGDHRIHTIALTNNPDSRLAQLCKSLVLTIAGEEKGPGTKTVVAQCVAMYQFAAHLARELSIGDDGNAEQRLSELALAPEYISTMLEGSSREQLDSLADSMRDDDVLYIVGSGPFYALALQAANIIREVAKVHCYPFEATEFRHGPLEAISKGPKVLVLTSKDGAAQEQVERACFFARKAGADLLYLGDDPTWTKVPFAKTVVLPTASEWLDAQLYLAPIQLLSFMLAKKRGFEPGVFSNIVKTWTE